MTKISDAAYEVVELERRSGLLVLWQKLQRRRGLARARRELMALDDRSLADIGIARRDIKGIFWNSSRRDDASLGSHT